MPQSNETTNVMQAIDLLRLFSTALAGDENGREKMIPNILGSLNMLGKSIGNGNGTASVQQSG